MNFAFVPEIFAAEELPDSPSSQPRLWVEAEDDILRLRWAEGVFASFIADELNRTKNSIIGRARRLGLEPRAAGWPSNPHKTPKPIQKNREVKVVKECAPLPMPVEKPIAETEYVHGTGVTLLDLEPRHCRWPINSPPKNDARYFFCGEPNVGGGLAYCLCHLRRSMSEDAFRRLRIAA